MVDRRGRSELHYCAIEGTADQARALLATGHDPNLADRDGFVPLHAAAQQGNLAVAEVLLEAGANVDAVNNTETRLCLWRYSIRRGGLMSFNCFVDTGLIRARSMSRVRLLSSSQDSLRIMT